MQDAHELYQMYQHLIIIAVVVAGVTFLWMVKPS